MTQRSYFWSCTNVGDGGLDSFSQEKVMTVLGMLGFTYDPELSGVIPWRNGNTTVLNTLGLGNVAADDELKPEFVSSPDRIRINKGMGVSGGIIYISNVVTDFPLATNISGYANAVDRIVLRRDIVNQTVRPVYIQATGNGLTAPLLYTNAYWDVPLVRIVLDGSGEYNSLIDDRKYVTSPSSGIVLLEQVSETIMGGETSSITHPIGDYRYSTIRLEITALPFVQNGVLDINFTPQFTNPLYGGSPQGTPTGWKWFLTTNSTNIINIDFYNVNYVPTVTALRSAFSKSLSHDGDYIEFLVYGSFPGVQEVLQGLEITFTAGDEGGGLYYEYRVYGIK